MPGARTTARARTATRVRAIAGAVLLAIGAAGLAACVPEPAPTATSTTSSPGATAGSGPSATPTAPAAVLELPASCEDIYSADMLAALNAQNPPLNDPGVTMFSTQNADALDLLGSGIPTLRCTWGTPSEYGLATNVSIVDADQAAALLQSLQEQGFGCADADGGTVCAIEQQVLSQDDSIVHIGEEHLLRGNGWVSTRWIDFHPDGYLDAISATLWG